MKSTKEQKKFIKLAIALNPNRPKPILPFQLNVICKPPWLSNASLLLPAMMLVLCGCQLEGIAGEHQLLLLGSSILIIILILLLINQKVRYKRLASRMGPSGTQIDPHFFSNSINAIESLVNLNQKKAASKYLIHFSRFTRRVLNSSLEPFTSLANEIETIKHFLALEQLRFKDKLHFDIEIANDINPTRIIVPALLFQPFLENAIWFGIKPKEGPGFLKIRIEKNDKLLRCLIEDDGIGRLAAKKQKEASILADKADGKQAPNTSLLQFGGRVEHFDLYEEDGLAKGTKVVLSLPYKTYKR